MISTASAKTLIAYFSCSGNTAKLAKTAATALGADLFEIVPEQKYTDADLNWRDANSRSSKEHADATSRPKFVKKADLAAYDTVVLAFPIWWYVAPRIIYSFVEAHDLSGKTVIPIATSGGSGMGQSGPELQKIASKTAVFKEGKVFSPSATADEIKAFFAGLK